MSNHIPDNSPSGDIQDWATDGAGEGEPALSLSDIEARLDSEMATLGTLTTDLGDIPESATIRQATFSNSDELAKWLDEGGLVFRDTDGTYIPNPIITIVKNIDPDDADFFDYEVYIDSETNIL